MRCPMLPTPIQPIVSRIALFAPCWVDGTAAGPGYTLDSGWRRNHHIRVGMALLDEAGMLEDVDGRLKGGLSDLHVRRPIAELLVGGDRARQHGEIDVLEKASLSFG